MQTGQVGRRSCAPPEVVLGAQLDVGAHDGHLDGDDGGQDADEE